MNFLHSSFVRSRVIQNCLVGRHVALQALGSSQVNHHSFLKQALPGIDQLPWFVHRLHTSSHLMVAPARHSKKKITKKISLKTKKKEKAVVTIERNMTVKELAAALGRDIDDVFECFLFVKHNTHKYDHPDKAIDNLDVIKETVAKCGFHFKMRAKQAKVIVDKDIPPRPPPDPASLVKRPPVVAIMGHIDHGKTTLLDSLRKSSVVSQEFGGITQHIGAFSVQLEGGELITFLDTPGHAAFHKMRSRGASLTDMVILVVAADDGAMAQTVESIKFAEQANSSIIVAINKIDRPEADVERTIQTLMHHGIVTEQNGGDIQAVPISALKGTNLSQLTEAIITLAEVLEVRGDPTGSVEGMVIESRLQTNKGKLCTMLVQRGTLKKGAFLVADSVYGKVRAIYDDRGKSLHVAKPGSAVEILGWKELPSAGDFIQEVASEKRALEVTSFRKQLAMDKKAEDDHRVYESHMEEHRIQYQNHRKLFMEKGQRFVKSFTRANWGKEEINTRTGPYLGVVIKGDVDGSVEAILDALATYRSDQIELDVISFGNGAVTEEDVQMAADFQGVVYAFNTSTPPAVQEKADQLGVTIADHNVIYRLVDDLKERLQEQLPYKDEEQVIGEGRVKELFMISEKKNKIPVAGCFCDEGTFNKKDKFKLLRNGQVIYDGELSSMRYLKKEVQAVNKNTECGLRFSDTSVVPEANDDIVCYKIVSVPQTLDWDTDF